ncbi:hypothetical protein LIER_18410 [Lithospermum erythrorhizon]|uniref:Uncharacterized protein n=1 Tax=Lithospermum erythrorhizon TaxID=34254 RepID=A0AAV3QGI6_LITER
MEKPAKQRPVAFRRSKARQGVVSRASQGGGAGVGVLRPASPSHHFQQSSLGACPNGPRPPKGGGKEASRPPTGREEEGGCPPRTLGRPVGEGRPVSCPYARRFLVQPPRRCVCLVGIRFAQPRLSSPIPGFGRGVQASVPY